MDRRRFLLTSLAGAIVAPLAAEAQQTGRSIGSGSCPSEPIPGSRSCGGRSSTGCETSATSRAATSRWGRAFAGGRAEDVSRLITELVRSEVDVIVTTGTRETMAAKNATSTIPIVMLLVADPVGQGFVKTLARPGGNVTGMTNLVPGLVQKYIELLRQAVPEAFRVAMIASPPNPLPVHRREVDAAAKAFGMVASIVQVNGPHDFDDVLARVKRDGVDAILAPPDGVTFLSRTRFVQTACCARIR
jgi:putative ABC transport system substrate-binding protein